VVLERLVFAVDQSVLDDWMEFEKEEWGPWLRQQQGFIRKKIDVRPGICVNNIWWKDKECLSQAASKKQDIMRKDLEMRRRFGSKVIRLMSN